MVASPTVLTGRLLSASIVSGVLLSLILYSRWPILAVPEGMMMLWRFNALVTSAGDSPLACNASMSRSTMITRGLPPYGNGTWAPCTTASAGRMKFWP